MIASRADDGFGDPQYVYALDGTQPGVSKPVGPPPAGGMLAPWLGHVDPLVLHRRVRVDGPPALTSKEWVRDFNEVKRVGSLTATGPHTARHQAVADFFYVNSVVSMERALVDYLRTHPMRLERAARMFAVMNASMADAVRNIWRLKLEVGFWRPAEAIVRAGEDGLDETVADANWKPFRATPPYSDYASGHANVTGTFAETARMFLGNHVPLTLESVPVAPPGVTPPSRHYATLSSWNTTRSWPASGPASTSATPWTTATTSPTRPSTAWSGSWTAAEPLPIHHALCLSRFRPYEWAAPLSGNHNTNHQMW